MLASPQFKKRTHRAKQKLDSVSPEFRWIFHACDKARAFEALPEPHVFATINNIQKYMFEKMDDELFDVLQEKNQAELSVIVSAGLMFAAWRMTQGIYRFDDEIYQAVITTEKTENLPTQILKRLPEWSVYIESPGLTCDFGKALPLEGFWATFGVSEHREVLMLHADVEANVYNESVPPIMVIDLAYQNLSEAIKAILAENQIYGDAEENKMSWVYPAINLLLYLCADREITHKGKILEPENPIPKKTKKGWKLFPNDGLKIWDVGIRMGEAIRQAKVGATAYDGEPTGRTVRPHIRRAHWRTILSGKLKDKDGNIIPSNLRKQDLRWMPPIAVKMDDVVIDEMPAVIRRVRK